MLHREQSTAKRAAQVSFANINSAEVLPFQKKSQKKRGKVKHREKTPQRSRAESLCSAVSRAASKIQIRSQRERCAKTALLNLPPGWFPPPLSFPPPRLPSCARSLAPSLRTKLVTPLFSYCADTRPFSLSRLPLSDAHTRSYLRSLADEIAPPAPPPSEFFPRLSWDPVIRLMRLIHYFETQSFIRNVLQGRQGFKMRNPRLCLSPS